jgi:hypothetical protein
MSVEGAINVVEKIYKAKNQLWEYRHI